MDRREQEPQRDRTAKVIDTLQRRCVSISVSW
jgi:hypothetical protein